MVEIIGVVFTERGEYGDFTWMIEQKEFDDALFIFNDNIEDHRSSHCGGGNAAIRVYNRFGTHLKYPRSAGIPTGSLEGFVYKGKVYESGGFEVFDDVVKKIIDFSIVEICNLVRKHGYKRIFYSMDKKKEHKLGTSIFSVCDEVIDYISENIYAIPEIIESIGDIGANSPTKLSEEHEEEQAESEDAEECDDEL